ncbi:MAG: hypothetical protein KDA75_02235 [Planctomycetaceae bacterium]|nr:hypothetical protein [Planctomycetaceae bacterium]
MTKAGRIAGSKLLTLSVCVFLLSGCSPDGQGSATGSLQGELAELQASVKRIETKLDSLGGSSAADSQALLERAGAEFEAGNDDAGYTFLAAALVSSPASPKALDMLEARARRAVEEMTWEDAASRVSLYGQAIRTAMSEGGSVEETDALLIRERRFLDLSDKLGESPIVQAPASSASLAKRVAELEGAAQKGGSEIDLRGLVIRAERLQDQAIEAMLEAEGEEFVRLVAETETLLAHLRGQLEVHTASRLQEDADRKTREVLGEVGSLLDEVARVRKEKESGKQGAKTWQVLGSQLVEAELLLGGVNPLSSATMRRESQEMENRLGRESVAVRASQQSAYNDWAVTQIRVAILEFKAGKGLADDDEVKFMAALSKTLGPIEPQHLHPAVSILYGEIYQKLISELDEDQKLTVTEEIERADKKSLLSF